MTVTTLLAALRVLTRRLRTLPHTQEPASRGVLSNVFYTRFLIAGYNREGSVSLASIDGRSRARLISKLENALGERLCVALDDPDVVEIMLNPDGRLFIERLDHGVAAAGEMARTDAETVIGSVAHALNSAVDDNEPIVSGELPIGGHRFEGLLPPVVAGPSFTIRRRASSRHFKLNAPKTRSGIGALVQAA